MTEYLIVIPCRAGSEGVPGKNTRLLNGQPLILHALNRLHEAAATLPPGVHVHPLVSTDDPVVAELARISGASVSWRPPPLCAPDVGLLDVLRYEANDQAWEGPVGMLQVTSPHLGARTIGRMIREFHDELNWATASTVTPAHGTSWINLAGSWVPHGGGMNRQCSPTDRMDETGGFRLIRDRTVLADHGFIEADTHYAFVLDDPIEALDIDTPHDLAVARLPRSRIRFVVEAGDLTGAGHLHRVLSIADELAGHDLRISWASTPVPPWALALTARAGIPDDVWDQDDLERQSQQMDVVVFDRLDTSVEEVGLTIAAGSVPISLEDRGPGATLCAATINELYATGGLTGPMWSVLRPEFAGPYVPPPDGRRVLVTFGGTDPAGMTSRALAAIGDAAHLSVMPGYSDAVAALRRPGSHVTEHPDGMLMATAMRDADLIVTSCGRTVHEAVALGRPVIAIAANEREASHVHVPGVVYLGDRWSLQDKHLRSTVVRMLANPDQIHADARQASKAVDGMGARRIADLIVSMTR